MLFEIAITVWLLSVLWFLWAIGNAPTIER